MRKKLMYLISDVVELYNSEYEELADHLIANGVEIPVRCKDCKHRYTLSSGMSFCKKHFPMGEKADDFCSYGEKREV